VTRLTMKLQGQCLDFPAWILQQVIGQFQVVVSEDQQNKFRAIRSAKL